MKKSKSLSADIANLLKPLPSEFGEEDELDNTSAKVLTAGSDDSDYGEINETSKIRAQNIDLLESVDEKYAGKVSKRRNYKDSDSDDILEEEVDSAGESSDDEENYGSDEEVEEEEHSRNNSDEEKGCSDESDIEDDSEVENGDDVDFKHFTDSTLKDESSKGIAVRKQLNIWESLLEMRIKLKKSMSASNNMPVGQKFKDILSNANEEYKIKLSQTKKNVNDMLENMLLLQRLLLNRYPETKKLLSHENEDNDEAQELSSDEESDEIEVKRRKVDHGKVLSERHEVYREYRNNTMEKWFDKTRIKHTETNAHSIVDRINHILMDKSKLIKKTQLKRSNYNIIGELAKEEEEYNVNIFDDEDFYHQQLRELVEFKSSDITDPLQLSRHWIQLQNIRSKMKRKIDTRATKGRKLKFVVHPKLVNHVACRDYDEAKTDEAKRELISSIFQKSN